jgi:hypothetical protein
MKKYLINFKLPLVWNDFYSDALCAFEKEKKKALTKMTAQSQLHGEVSQAEAAPTNANSAGKCPPVLRIHPKEMELTLLLAMSLKLLMSYSLTKAAIKRRQSLLIRYLLLFKKVYSFLPI